MTTAWAPPRRSYYLRVFSASLILLLIALCGFLFGVRLEAIAPATGIITARDLLELRAPQAGLVEPGWYSDNGQFHRLQPGDHVGPGQVIATIRSAELSSRLDPAEERRPPQGNEPASLVDLFRLDRLRNSTPAAVLRVPESGQLWMTVQVSVVSMQAVQAGDPIVSLVPIDPQTKRPRDLIARLEIDEKHWSEVTPGQAVRIYSTMYNPRLHGHAAARIDHLEPCGEESGTGQRRFRATATVTDAPFDLWLGSSFKGEVVLGKKRVYRIILEN